MGLIRAVKRVELKKLAHFYFWVMSIDFFGTIDGKQSEIKKSFAKSKKILKNIFNFFQIQIFEILKRTQNGFVHATIQR